MNDKIKVRFWYRTNKNQKFELFKEFFPSTLEKIKKQKTISVKLNEILMDHKYKIGISFPFERDINKQEFISACGYEVVEGEIEE